MGSVVNRNTCRRTLGLLLAALVVLGEVRSGFGEGQEISQLRKAADEGDARAQYSLGAKYAQGRGVPQDDAEAVKWYRLAAEQGLALAKNQLGVMYGEGRGVPQDSTEAARWYRLAAEQGLAGAQYNLGVKYALGEGIGEDDQEAVKWFRRAAEGGNADAQHNLGVMYALGQGVREDYVKAYAWWTLTAAQGDQESVKFKGWLRLRMTLEQLVEARTLASDLYKRIESTKANRPARQGVSLPARSLSDD